MTQSTRIRVATADEAELLSALALRSKAHWGYSREFIMACEAELTYRPSQIDNPGFDFMVMESDSEILGFYALEAISKAKLELAALFVEPDHIGKGLGRQLIEHARVTAAHRGGTTLLIQGDPNAEAFYLSVGCKPAGTRESGSVPGRFLPLFEMTVNHTSSST